MVSINTGLILLYLNVLNERF